MVTGLGEQTATYYKKEEPWTLDSTPSFVLMKNLPIELVGIVVRNVASHTDLCSLRTVNSTCHDLVTPHLFSQIHVHNSVQSARHCQSILASPSLAAHVRRVVYDQRDHAQFCLIPPGAQGTCDELEIAELEDALIETFCSISSFKNLQSIALNFWPSFRSQSGLEVQEHPFWFTSRQIAVLHAVHHAIKSSPSIPIRSLTLNNIVLVSSACYDFVSSINHSPLHRFSMSIVANSELGVWSGSKAINGLLSALLPAPNANLTSLVLRTPHGLYHSPHSRLRTFHYPMLETLVLENMVFDPTPTIDGIEEFIVRHKATLRRLELRSCATYVPSLTTPVRTWSTIWQRLEEELVCLTELVVGSIHPGYALLDGNRGYVPHPTAFVECAKQDKEALARFSDRVSLCRSESLRSCCST